MVAATEKAEDQKVTETIEDKIVVYFFVSCCILVLSTQPQKKWSTGIVSADDSDFQDWLKDNNVSSDGLNRVLYRLERSLENTIVTLERLSATKIT